MIVGRSGEAGLNRSGWRAALPSVESAQDEQDISPNQMGGGTGCRVGDGAIYIRDRAAKARATAPSSQVDIGRLSSSL